MRGAIFNLENGIDLQINVLPTGYQLVEVVDWNDETPARVKEIFPMQKDFVAVLNQIFFYSLTEKEFHWLESVVKTIEETAKTLKSQVNEMVYQDFA